MRGDLDLCTAFIDVAPDDAAGVLERLAVADVAALFDRLPAEAAARVLHQMTPAAAAGALDHMQSRAAAGLVAALRTDVAAALLRRIDNDRRATLLETMPEPAAAFLRTLLQYPDGSAGALMDPRVMAVAHDVTAGEALSRVRRAPRHMLYYLYVVDRARQLVGVVDVRELMLARPAEAIGEVMHRPVQSLSARMTHTAILAHPGWQHFHALPVVDEQSTLLGAVRYQTFRALEDHARVRSRRDDTVAAVFALGELYWLGLSGLLDGLASLVKPAARGRGSLEIDDGSQ